MRADISLPANILAILKDPLTTDDIVDLLKDRNLTVEYDIPRIPLGPSLMLNVPTFLRVAKVDGASLSVANLDYPTGQRGVIQALPSTTDQTEISRLFTVLHSLISNSSLNSRMDFYELSLSFVKNEQISWPKSSSPRLKSMDPSPFGIRLFEGKLGSADVRTQPWREIRIEPSIENPTNIFIQVVYRVRGYEQGLVDDVFSDIDALLTHLKEVEG